jgi:predicted O-methyltransferase YrrM
MFQIKKIDPQLKKIADNTPGFMPEKEGLALYYLSYIAAFSKLGPIVELGTYCGKSTIYLAAGANFFSTQVITIDHHQGSEEMQAGWQHHDPRFFDETTGRLETLFEFRNTLKRIKLPNIIAIIGESTQVSSSIDLKASLVFIDGGHAKEVAHNDYIYWSKKLALGGFLAIHDVFEDPKDGGQAPFEIFLEALSSKKFIHVLTVGSLRALKKITD